MIVHLTLAQPLVVSGPNAALIRLMAAYPDRLDADEADRVLAAIANGDDPCRVLLDRRIVHVAAVTCSAAATMAMPGSRWSSMRLLVDAIADVQLKEYIRVRTALDEAGIEALVPKGLFFTATVYPHLPRPFSGDVDLLVRRADLKRAHEEIMRLGYSEGLVVRRSKPVKLPGTHVERLRRSPWLFGQLPPLSRLVRAPELDEHATTAQLLFPFHIVVAGGQVYLRPSFDLHFSLNLLGDDDGTRQRPTEADWWSSVRRVRYRGATLDVPSDTVVAWAVAYRWYHDAMLFCDTSWKGLADLLALVHLGRVDFGALADTVGRLSALRPPVFYVYRILRQVFGAPVPHGFLTEISEQTTTPLSDLGDVLPRLVGVRPEYTIVNRTACANDD